ALLHRAAQRQGNGLTGRTLTLHLIENEVAAASAGDILHVDPSEHDRADCDYLDRSSGIGARLRLLRRRTGRQVALPVSVAVSALPQPHPHIFGIDLLDTDLAPQQR